MNYFPGLTLPTDGCLVCQLASTFRAPKRVVANVDIWTTTPWGEAALFAGNYIRTVGVFVSRSNTCWRVAELVSHFLRVLASGHCIEPTIRPSQTLQKKRCFQVLLVPTST